MLAEHTRPHSSWEIHAVLAFASVVFVCTASIVHGQTPPNQSIGHLHGTVTDSNGAVVPAAKVTFRSEVGSYSTSTNDIGTYDIDLSNGIYEMTVVKAWFCYHRAPFRITVVSLTINAAISPCAIAQVLTITDGVSTVRHELRPAFKEESVVVPGQSAPQLKLLITYSNREEDADITTYSGNVVVTYDCLTISASRVRFDHKALRVYPEGHVSIEDGKQLSTDAHATVRFEKGNAVVQLN